MGDPGEEIGGLAGFDTATHNAAISFALAFTVAELRRENDRLKDRVADLQAERSAWDREVDSEPEPYPTRPPCEPPTDSGPTREMIDELAAKIAASMPAAGSWSVVSPPPAPTSFYPAPVVGPPPVAPSILWTPDIASPPLSPTPAVPATDEEIAARFGLAPHQVQAAIERGMPVVGPIVSAAAESGLGEGAEGGPPASGEENYAESLPERTADDARYRPIGGDVKTYPAGFSYKVRDIEHGLPPKSEYANIRAEYIYDDGSRGPVVDMSLAQWAKGGSAATGTNVMWTPAHLAPKPVFPAAGALPSIASSFARPSNSCVNSASE